MDTLPLAWYFSLWGYMHDASRSGTSTIFEHRTLDPARVQIRVLYAGA